jgi:hypothetical protein
MIVSFGEWAPDRAAVNGSISSKAENVLPINGSYAPVRSLTSIGASALPSEVKVGPRISFKDSSGVEHTFCGTATKLYKLSGTTWSDVTRVSGGDYATATDDRWIFEQFGDLVVATNGADPIQKFNLASGTNFEPLGGSPPICKRLKTIGDFLFLEGLPATPNKIKWSALNNAEIWAVGTGLSDEQTFPDGGHTTGITGDQTAYIFQEGAIRRAGFLPGSQVIFQIDKIAEGEGTNFPYSIVQTGRKIFYRSQNGFNLLSEDGPVPIGAGKVDEFISADTSPGTNLNVLSVANPQQKNVFWSYVSVAQTGSTPDRIIAFNWGEQRWSIIKQSTTSLVSALSVGETLEGLDTFGLLDTLPASLDDSLWAGGEYLFGAFNTTNELSGFTGPALEAVVETDLFQANPSGRAFVRSVEPIVDTADTMCALATKERYSDIEVWTPETGVGSTGKCPFHKEGRLHRLRVRIPSGSVWTKAVGVAIEAGSAGET